MSKTLPRIEVMTAAEAARFLRIKKSKLLQLAANGNVPARRIDDEWRFLKSALEAWLHGERPKSATGRDVMLSQAGIFKDDESLLPMLEEIYKARGRPMVEDQASE